MGRGGNHQNVDDAMFLHMQCPLDEDQMFLGNQVYNGYAYTQHSAVDTIKFKYNIHSMIRFEINTTHLYAPEEFHVRHDY